MPELFVYYPLFCGYFLSIWIHLRNKYGYKISTLCTYVEANNRGITWNKYNYLKKGTLFHTQILAHPMLRCKVERKK